MKKEYQIVIDGDLPKQLEAEINEAIKSAVMQKLAKIDFSEKVGIRGVGGIGGGQTDGLHIELTETK